MDQIHWKVLQITPETKDASTIFLQNLSGQDISYRSGQFLTLLFPGHRESIRRSYSFSSTPGVDSCISITIQRVSNGVVSRHLLDHLKPGDELHSLMPAGRFTLDPETSSQRQVFFFAAGSGITPVFSLLKKILHDDSNTMAVLVYQNHNEQEIIFNHQLKDLEKKYADQFLWINLISRPISPLLNPQKLTNTLVEQIIAAHRQPRKEIFFFLCGPDLFMRMIQFTLKWLGFADEQIRKEFFTIDRIPLPPLIADRGTKQIELHRNGKKHHFTVAYPTNILQAALNHHIVLPFSCRAGRCSTCVARCISGRVKMSVNEVLTEADLRNGLVLTCVGFAETDLELEI